MIPLAERMRPKTLNQFIGQEHLVGEKGIIRKFLQHEKGMPSLIFWGPPGTGKTTLAQIISDSLGTLFYTISAISSGVKDIRNVIDIAKKQGKVTLFIDEIHRFNKSQQDALLGAIEKGLILLIGATTENPSFEVVNALLSRCQVYSLYALETPHLSSLIDIAIAKDKILAQKNIVVEEKEALIHISAGDGRKLLNLLECVIFSFDVGKDIFIQNRYVYEVAKNQISAYDKKGEYHYDMASALIKSIRGSHPQAALYWLARMIISGEDPIFIARRLLILSSEDIGVANPTALVIANSCFQATQSIGYPECEIILSQTVVYLATSFKSNSTYQAIKRAKKIAQQTTHLPVPLHLRNAPTKLMKDMQYGEKYKYPHDYKAHFVEQSYLPESIKDIELYKPSDNAREKEIRRKINQWWKESPSS